MEKYERLDQVGEGSFGQVFKARIRGSNEIVAIKVMSKVCYQNIKFQLV